VQKLLREHQGQLQLLPNIGDMEGWYVLRSTATGVQIQKLCKQYQIETLRDYRNRSRQQINQLRKEDKHVN